MTSAIRDFSHRFKEYVDVPIQTSDTKHRTNDSHNIRQNTTLGNSIGPDESRYNSIHVHVQAISKLHFLTVFTNFDQTLCEVW